MERVDSSSLRASRIRREEWRKRAYSATGMIIDDHAHERYVWWCERVDELLARLQVTYEPKPKRAKCPLEQAMRSCSPV
jgi:hypothetical protein